MKLLLNHVDSPYIRAIGFLYLRYAGEPSSIWGWIEPYLYDDEPIAIKAQSSKGANQRHESESETIGGFVRQVFSSKRDFHGTMLPRLPLQVERDLEVKLRFAERIQERAKKHLSDRKTMDYFKTLGSRVMALYGDDENPITWYEGVVDRVVLFDEGSSTQLAVPKFIVTFPEYGNTETVTLGEIEMMGVPLDSVSKEKHRMEERRGSRNSNLNDMDARRSRDRRLDKTNDRINSDRDWKDDRRHYSNEGYYDKNDIRRGYGGTSRGYPSGDDGRRRERECRRGYSDRDHNNSGESRYRGGNTGRSSSSRIPCSGDLYEEIRRRERANVTEKGKQSVARRSGSENASASDQWDRNRSKHESKRSFHSIPQVNESAPESAGGQRSAEDIAAKQEKRRKLIDRKSVV